MRVYDFGRMDIALVGFLDTIRITDLHEENSMIFTHTTCILLIWFAVITPLFVLTIS